MTYEPASLKQYSVDWSEEIGTVHKNLSYGEEEAQKFDLYVPADNTQKAMVWLFIFMQVDLLEEIRLMMHIC